MRGFAAAPRPSCVQISGLSLLQITKPFILSLTEKKDLIGKMREYCKAITVDDLVRKAYEIQMSTHGPLTNLKFGHNSDKVKQKQAYAS